MIRAVRIIAPAHTLRDDLLPILRDLAHAAPELAGRADIFPRCINGKSVTRAYVLVLMLLIGICCQ